MALAVLGLLELSSFDAVLAAPPHPAPRFLHPAADLHLAAPAPPLDLRPPAARLDTFAAGSDATSFPSSQHRSLDEQPPLQIPVLGAGDAQARIPSRMEELAQRVHREGLPVARLWENKAALVSLGLNQRGKPGLWIVQKIH